MENFSPELESKPKVKVSHSILLLCASVLAALSLVCSAMLYIETQSLEAQCASLREALDAQQASYQEEVQQLTQEIDELHTANDSAMEYITKLNKRTAADDNAMSGLLKISSVMFHKQSHHSGKVQDCPACTQLFDKNVDRYVIDFYYLTG